MDARLKEVLEANPALNQVASVILGSIGDEKAGLIENFWNNCTNPKFDKQGFMDRMIVLRAGEILIEETLKRIKIQLDKG